MTTPADPELLHRDLLDWYAIHARDLPWRRSGDPYAVLVSEVMLQQTQVDRVVPKFREFLDAYPTIEALAAASVGDLLRHWAPLGYNARAVRLQRLAQVVVRDHSGRIPTDVADLRRLPGIGPYTSAAVVCFAFGASVPLADTNICRVLSRVVHGVKAATRPAATRLAAALTPRERAGDWHQALMDLGATLCTASKPRCQPCPLRPHCRAAPVLQAAPSATAVKASVPPTPRPSRFAGSSRFYRGRVLAALRQLPPGAWTTAGALGRQLRPDYGPAHADWFTALLQGLERDGLVRLESQGRTLRIALP